METWNEVDRYFIDTLGLSDPALENALRESDDAGLPAISVSAPQGKLLQILALTCGARSILEIGTLGGYSTIWLARALPPGGRMITLELDPHHAEVARANLRHAGVDGRVTVRVGSAVETLGLLDREGAGPFDFVFIDADKPSNPQYVEWAVRLARRGTLIVLDNVVRGGKVILRGSEDASVQGVRRAMDIFATDGRLSVTAIQTVGTKGYDGFAVALVVAEPRAGAAGR
ncbi:MAG: O-methyltransferase [Usitatibacter sp.]